MDLGISVIVLLVIIQIASSQQNLWFDNMYITLPFSPLQVKKILSYNCIFEKNAS